MKERPILFNTEMVKAILDGRKTMTRRVIKPQPEITYYKGLVPHADYRWKQYSGLLEGLLNGLAVHCPYGQVGDRLWVRETWSVEHYWDYLKPSEIPNEELVAYTNTDWDGYRVGKTRPSIFMPRWASRITLEITGIRAERLQDITEEDATAEGITEASDCFNAYEPNWDLDRKDAFIRLWDSINAKRGYSWESNPWVWVIEFKAVNQ